MSAADWLARVRGHEARGELLLAYDTALQGLAEHPEDLWLAHRAVLNLAKAGATARAESEFARLGLARSQETEVAALAARIAKDRALAAPAHEREGLLARAADLYEAAHLRGGGYYPAVNAASLRLLAGQSPAAERLAREVHALCAKGADEPYYRAASEAEAALVQGDTARACDALARAAAAGGDLAARAATRRQLRRVCAARGIADDLLHELAPPTVIHYTGHMIAAEGAVGRFPAEREAAVAAQIAEVLARQRVGFGYGALACGADILFAEALLARGAELHVVLPFEREEFVAVSVAPAGPAWVERFHACLARATSLSFATDDRQLGHEWIFAYGSFLAMGLASLRARFLDAPVRQVAVWDGQESAGVAGTGFDVRLWRESGRALEVITPDPGAAPAPVRVTAAPAPGQRELKAMLFGDIQGFSRLSETQVTAFVTHVLGAFAGVLAQYGGQVLYRNTWGDGLFVVLADPALAARCALKLQAAMAAIDLAQCGLPESLALRLGGHFGPVYEAVDPVLGLTNYFGAHVSRTARIEPVTPAGEVYVTEQFAARLALDPDGFDCDYVGLVPAAKGYGSLRMYHLRAGPAHTF
ncbi:adenylate/guanylate cyclase domain-containing protein [Arenimonas terrae]|uniref:Adenylate/guanylate cyclase domain-containing protein n=1 Tax=Arenimonas terrae TaxID=2546226 RepID=A0A5C4RV28_9GAMM|nr:adenylate/guanylate cyclase domain-containing protein [Arenimonas terrae]TNJ35030.1 adenylate/guanylate cyclase domain-containing protein [Arenimonas terrae]